MDFKHFSHTHPLVFHQMPQVTETINCSGCKTLAPGTVYACWQCRYFLHEQCYHAARSIKHPSHPLHPLTLVPFPTYESNTFICNSCTLSGTGFSYSCSECDFDIHVHCANPLPNTTTHHVSPYHHHAAPPVNNVPNFPVPNAQDFNPHNLNQNPIYPPIQNNPFPNYPPHA